MQTPWRTGIHAQKDSGLEPQMAMPLLKKDTSKLQSLLPRLLFSSNLDSNLATAQEP